MSSRCSTCKDVLAKDPFGLLEAPYDVCLECSEKKMPKTVSELTTFFDQKLRPSKDIYYLDIALAVARRSTCLRSAYGSVIVINDGIASTGYNGPRSGAENCCDRGSCLREGAESRKDYGDCPAVHAELNSLLRRRCPTVEGATLYLAGFSRITGEEKSALKCLPCKNCYSAMVQAGIKKLIIRADIWPGDDMRRPWIMTMDYAAKMTGA